MDYEIGTTSPWEIMQFRLETEKRYKNTYEFELNVMKSKKDDPLASRKYTSQL